MKLYIREKKGIWINFIHNVQELRDFIENYIPGRPMVIGDLSTFSNQMINTLLKFVEENSEVDCYSSQDLLNPILLSRFTVIIKQPITLVSNNSVEDFLNSDKSYLSAMSYLESYDSSTKLLVPLLNQKQLSLLW